MSLNMVVICILLHYGMIIKTKNQKGIMQHSLLNSFFYAQKTRALKMKARVRVLILMITR